MDDGGKLVQHRCGYPFLVYGMRLASMPGYPLTGKSVIHAQYRGALEGTRECGMLLFQCPRCKKALKLWWPDTQQRAWEVFSFLDINGGMRLECGECTRWMWGDRLVNQLMACGGEMEEWEAWQHRPVVVKDWRVLCGERCVSCGRCLCGGGCEQGEQAGAVVLVVE